MNERSNINRRQFLASSLALAAAAHTKKGFGQDSYDGPYLITIDAAGGWDLSLFCDPKVNQPGEAEITNWSNEADPVYAGNIPVAPIGSNVATFKQLGHRTLVINGVDTQTNAHQTGTRHTWTGSPNEGRPSLAALFAAAQAPELPLALMNFGGFSASSKLIRPVQLPASNLKWLTRQSREADINLLERFRTRGLDLARQNSIDTPWGQERAVQYLSSQKKRLKLGALNELLPDELESPIDAYSSDSRLKSEIQASLLAFKAGLAAAAECRAGGNWDTHGSGEWSQLLNINALNESLLYLWQFAEAMGIAEKIIVVVSSDFGRTPYYNSSGGKDHWPINSYLVMANDPIWGGRVAGHTDELQNASKIDPQTLQVSSSGSLIYPKHVHHALHHYLGISEFARSVGYDYTRTELYDFFNPALTTA